MSHPDRPSTRDIERTQPGLTNAPPVDPGGGLRAHMQSTPRREFAPIPQSGARYMFHIHNAEGGYVGSETPERAMLAEQRAERLKGFVTVTQIVRDYRPEVTE